MDGDQKAYAQLVDEVADLRQQISTLHTVRIEAESVIATVREPLVVLSAELRVISTNQAFYQTFQVTPAETIDHLLYELGNGQWDIPALRQFLGALLPIGSSVYDFEVTHLFPRVGQKIMLLNARRIDDEHTPSRILLAIEDITERQWATQLLQQRSEWFSQTLTSIGDAVLATDTTTAITFMNPEAERLTGWTTQEALGRAVRDVLILRDEDPQQALADPFQQALREGVSIRLANHPLLVNCDGKAIPIDDSVAPIRGFDGTLQGAVMVFRDVTEQANLERRLVRNKETAEAADRAKSEFLATMSHELRTPLGVILGYTELMSEGEFGAMTEKGGNVLRRVHQSATALLELITAMLDLSRLEAGRLSVYVQEVKIPPLFEVLKIETQEICEQAQLDVMWQVEDTLLSLHTDREKLKTIIKNLLGNALKFTPQGRITVQARARKDGIEFCVVDTGIGMPEHTLTTIFEPFRQIDGNDRGAQRGTGLGLHIVKRLVELLGGTVEVESEVGMGSTFHVWLPNAEPLVA